MGLADCDQVVRIFVAATALGIAVVSLVESNCFCYSSTGFGNTPKFFSLHLFTLHTHILVFCQLLPYDLATAVDQDIGIQWSPHSQVYNFVQVLRTVCNIEWNLSLYRLFCIILQPRSAGEARGACAKF